MCIMLPSNEFLEYWNGLKEFHKVIGEILDLLHVKFYGCNKSPYVTTAPGCPIE
jgi:hypothetical protein